TVVCGLIKQRIFLLLFLIAGTGANANAVFPAPITQAVHMCGSSLGWVDEQGHRPRFESIPSRPMALSNDGKLLFAVNTMANCLEIFEVLDNTLALISTVNVGVDPVAVA